MKLALCGLFAWEVVVTCFLLLFAIREAVGVGRWGAFGLAFSTGLGALCAFLLLRTL